MVAVVAATFYKKQKSIVMKKLTAIVAALALFASAGAFNPIPKKEKGLFTVLNKKTAKFVSPEKVSRQVSNAFKEKFEKAVNVKWTQEENLYFAIFEMNEKEYTVAYSEKGELIGISRCLYKDQLPLAVMESLNEKYKNYILPASVSEIVFEGVTNYYLTIEGETRYLQLKCSPDGSISVNKRIKKKVLVGKVY